ncbi:OmpA family protein [Hahella ganghwensis]|uniref:OmpA family protein n=1 Tax=Hahella ganghwensis TaxID=286420 RepID=UPI0005259754|nr:OmpA family protein [Hahella ganghwensis]
MKLKTLSVLLTAGAILASSPTWSRDRDSGAYLTGLLGYTFFDQERQLEDDPNYGIGLGYDFNRRFSAEVVAGIADLEGDNDNSFEVDQKFYRLDGLIHFNTDDVWRPFIVGGVSNNDFDYPNGNKQHETQYNLGAGIKHEISEALDLRFDVRGVYGEEDESKDTTMNLGLVAMLGGSSMEPEDSDGDGVYDDDDACPGTAYGVEVDAEGCEIERDSDNDGVMDNDDQCPNTKPGTRVDAEGCPVTGDKDGDGVADNADKCPNTPAKAEVDSRGCPLDSDKDGIANGLDACPSTPQGAKVDNRGCRIVLQQAVSMDLGINFATNSAEITDEHASEISKLATFMRQYPDTNAVIEGHTDDRGNADYNKQLSQRRAEAVKTDLVDNYSISASRIQAIGYGEEQPVADNDTAAGRAENRRVVANVSATKRVEQ